MRACLCTLICANLTRQRAFFSYTHFILLTLGKVMKLFYCVHNFLYYNSAIYFDAWETIIKYFVTNCFRTAYRFSIINRVTPCEFVQFSVSAPSSASRLNDIGLIYPTRFIRPIPRINDYANASQSSLRAF